MSVRLLGLTAILSAMLLAACGSGGGSAYCPSYCGWKKRCGKEKADCVSECNADAAKFKPYWRYEFESGLASCLSTLDCKSSDDKCIAQAFAAVEPNITNNALYQKCMKKRSDCKAQGGGTPFQDDYCFSIIVLKDEYRQKCDQCLDGACSGVKDCLKNNGAFSY